MRAVLRLWWTLFTAVPVQRHLSVVGLVLFSLAVIAALVLRELFWVPFGYLAFVVFAAFPALFTAPSLLRALSAARPYQLLPHFRLRMLTATSLVLLALLVLAASVPLGLVLLSERPPSISALSVALSVVFAFLVATFLLLFHAFGDWRWAVLMPIALVVLVRLRQWSPATAGFLAALPIWVWSAAALGAWAIFAAWYLRVRQVRPVMLMPQRAAKLDAARPVSRAVALRTLLAANAWSVATSKNIGFRITPLGLLVVAICAVVITGSFRFFSLTTADWPLAFMLLFGERSAAVVHQSRLLWLKVPGSRDAVRREIEKVLLRNWAIGIAFLVVVAAIAVSPLVGAGAAHTLLGLAATAGAAIYGTYVAMAAVPSVATYFWGFGPMLVLQIALFARPAPSLTAIAAVATIELAGAALLRALVVSRWRTVDWLRLRPLGRLTGLQRSL